MKAYKSNYEVYEQLEQFCVNAGNNGTYVLPGERSLAEMFKTSRTTLRKALERAEINGLVLRQNKVMQIARIKRVPKNLKNVLFVAWGYHTEFTLGACFRLWSSLNPELKAFGMNSELFFVNEDTSVSELQACCENIDLLLISYFPEHLSDAIASLQRDVKIISIVGIADKNRFENNISLDNFAAGKLAAEALYNAGCTKTIFIFGGSKELNFIERRDGFTQTARNLGIKSAVAQFGQPNNVHYVQLRKDALNEAVENGFDGAFIASDESIDFIIHDVVAKGLVPDKFNIVTLNGSGNAFRCKPAVTCVSHGTRSITKELMKYIRKLDKNIFSPPIKKLIKPHLYINDTCGK